MDNKFKYAKFTKNRKYASGGLMTLATTGGSALGSGISNAAYNSDGTVNTNQYIAGNVLGSVAAGAGAGAVAGPWGALAGGAIGLGAGLYKGITGAKNINEQAEAKKAQEEAYQAELAKQKAEFEAQQQDAYNKAYYAANPIKGNQGSIYMAKGGKLPKYPGGGRLSPLEWEQQNTKAGYMVHPNIVNSGKTSGDYKSYYDPTKFTPEYNADGSIRWTKNGDPNYNFKTGVETPIIQYTPPPTMLPGNTYMNDASKTYASVEKKAKGGVLNPLASDVVKAEGATHAEGGIKLANKGKVYAEVEDQEIIQGNNVYSDRITLPNSKTTVAMEAEKLAKLKGKSEKYLVSSNYREKNSAERKTDYADKKLEELFNYQEASKVPVMNGQKLADGGTINDLAQLAVPYIDNLYNASLTNKTPNIPLPTVKETYYAKAMPLKTTVDVNNELNNVNDAYRNFTANTNNNTSSSNVARGNNLAAFAKVLQSKNSIYQNKNNIETQLTNQNQQNIQNVNNANTQNAQNIANANLAAKDNYNMNNMYRTDDINRRKSSNIADVVNNATTQIQDANDRALDQDRIVLDTLSYSDGAGLSKLIGTPSFDKIIKSNKDYYNKAEQTLKNSGQTKALEDFYKRYGKNN